MAMKNKKIPHYKILVLGDPAVGKSCFLARYVENTFDNIYMSTAGMDYKYKDVDLGDGNQIKLQIWDTAGQERYRTLTTNLYKGAVGIVLIYDITNKKSFASVKPWIESIEEETDKKIILVLVGNKVDLKDEREVLKEEGEDIASKFKIPFFEASAQSGLNVKSVFETLAKLIFEKKVQSVSQGEKLTNIQNVEKKKCC